MSAEAVRRQRCSRVSSYLADRDIDWGIIQDTEGRRNTSLFYLSGMPGDALLFISRSGKTILVPWDTILAGRMAVADETLPYTDFHRDTVETIDAVLRREGAESGRVELSSSTPYTLFHKIKDRLPRAELVCSESGMDDEILLHRSVKDPVEREIYRRASAVTNDIIDELAGGMESGKIARETDIAFFIETRSREKGCQGTGFETIAAGPRRSFGIHAYPGYTAASIGENGFTIIDFGVNLEGYTTDVTLTLARGTLSERQNRMCEAVNEAYALAEKLLMPGKAVTDIGKAVDRYFSEHGFYMPHALGHGIGLDAHETPILKSDVTRDNVLKEGMIITLEPGLYDEESGGVRLENDFLITRDGAEALTTSRILYAP